MKELLAIEWLKIRRYTTFWVLGGLFVALLPLWNLEIATGLLKMGGGKGVNFLDTAYSFPMVWGNLGFWGSIFILFVSMLVIILTTNEFGYRTHRQNVIDGWSRIQFYNAKVFVAVILSAVVTVYLIILGMIFGGVNSGSLSGMFTDFKTVGYFFLLSLDYIGFALFIGIWIRKSGLAIGLFLLYTLIIENILKGLINHVTNSSLGNFLFLQASDELLPFPLIQMAKKMIEGESISPNIYAAVTMMWCAAYYYFGRLMLMKRDW